MSGKESGKRGVWYAEGLCFECTRCGDCCRGEPGFVWVGRSEIARIAEFLGMSEREFRRRHCRRVFSRISLKELSNGDCIFWKDGCTIYEARPRQCRTFPWWGPNLESPEAWRETMLRCRGCGKGRLWTYEEIREAMDA
jgi:Fe-S-cluster containining protein